MCMADACRVFDGLIISAFWRKDNACAVLCSSFSYAIMELFGYVEGSGGIMKLWMAIGNLKEMVARRGL